MQRYSLEVIEQRRWQIWIEAESKAEAIKQIQQQQNAADACLLGTSMKVINCMEKEK